MPGCQKERLPAPGMSWHPRGTVQQNKTPVVEMLPIARHCGDIAGTEGAIRREEQRGTGRRPRTPR